MGDELRDHQMRCTTCKDAPLYLSVNIRMHRNEAGTPLYLEGFVVDVTHKAMPDESATKH